MITIVATSTIVDRRDMEPSDGTERCLSNNKRMINSFSTFAFLFIAGISMPMSSLRMRGGGDDEKYNDIPSLTSSKFMWDGLPCIDFQEKIMYPLNMGLGSVYVKGSNQTGATLLQTVKQTDPGGTLGTPARAVAPQAVIDDSDARNNKAYHTIMNFINRSSEVYMMIVREYSITSSGIAIYVLLPALGTLATPPKMVKMISTRHTMTMTVHAEQLPTVPDFMSTDVLHPDDMRSI